MATRANWRRGFTLIEVSIAAAVILISLAGLTGGAVALQRQSSHQARVTQAVGVLETITEELLTATDSDPRLASGGHSQGFNQAGNRVSSGAYFTTRWSVADSQPFAGQRRLTLSVKWIDITGPHSFSWVTNRR